MPLGGKLDDLSFLELLRLLSSLRATGGLLIKGDSIATLNFHLGELVYVGVEGHPLRLGERFVDEGCMTQEQLKQALLTQQRQKPWRPLGAICVETGSLKPEELQRILKNQMMDLVRKLVGWKFGQFRFAEGEVAISDEISLDVYEFLHDVIIKLTDAKLNISETNDENRLRGLLTETSDWAHEIMSTLSTDAKTLETLAFSKAYSQLLEETKEISLIGLTQLTQEAFGSNAAFVEVYHHVDDSPPKRWVLHASTLSQVAKINFAVYDEKALGNVKKLGDGQGAIFCLPLSQSERLTFRWLLKEESRDSGLESHLRQLAQAIMFPILSLSLDSGNFQDQ